MIGRIIKGIAGFYYVKTDDTVIECKARGKFRHYELTPMVGDEVEVIVKNGKGTIEKVLPRKSELYRPAVSNVTQAFVIFCVNKPNFNFELVNKFLVLCESNNLKVVLCLNKYDLIEDYEEAHSIVDLMKSAKYDVIILEAKNGKGIDDLYEHLEDNITVLCGPSGVGKSTILNNLCGYEAMETGEISNKLGRGKHTTRHSELKEVKNGFLVDTPGFSNLQINNIEPMNLQYYFPEFEEYIGNCKFTGCVHNKEPHCAVKDAVENKKINELRYEFYIKFLNELIKESNNKW
jgi:ribosome biogenesis GTPase